MTLGDQHPEHTPQEEAAVLTLTLLLLLTCPARSQEVPRPKGSSTPGTRAPRHSPTSSLANLTSRRATYSGSSPPSSMRPSQ